jgi:MFS superfamily sulfate permease-like transporter
VDGLPGYHDLASYPQAAQIPHCVLYRFDAPLIFANARTFRDEVRHLASTMEPGDWIIVAAEPMTDVDTTACDMLDDLAIELDGRGVRLVFAEMKDPVRSKLAMFGMEHALPDDRFYPTISAAVAAGQAAPRRSGD